MSSGSMRSAMACGAHRGEVDVPPPGPAMPMRSSISCGLVLGDRVLEGDVAGGEPHLLVAALVLVAGLVAGVGLVQAAVEVGHGRARDVLVEAALQVGDDRVADHAAEALDGADAGQRGDDRLAARRAR